jgi:hypothetical protein
MFLSVFGVEAFIERDHLPLEFKVRAYRDPGEVALLICGKVRVLISRRPASQPLAAAEILGS